MTREPPRALDLGDLPLAGGVEELLAQHRLERREDEEDPEEVADAHCAGCIEVLATREGRLTPLRSDVKTPRWLAPARGGI
jgi:hypothetical protein